MVQRISGLGVGLPLPQNLYPTQTTIPGQSIAGVSPDAASNRVCIPPGAAMPVPPGEWYINLGMYLVLQYLDPITNTWTMGASGGWEGENVYCFSDGFTYRIANVLCTPIGAVIINAGSGYVQASTTIAVTGGGGSTWAPIVGGQLTVSGGTLIANGGGYGVPPLALLPAPPPAAANPNGVGGHQASGYFTIASGTVSGFTFTNPGAGYASGFTIAAVPSPFDPNLSVGITLATIAFSLTASGSLTGALCTNGGNAISNPANLTLTVAGVGSSGSLNAVVPQTILTASVSGAGTGFGTVNAKLTTTGGAPGTAVFATSPDTLRIGGKPRPADVTLAVTALGTIGTQLGTIVDGGFFFSLPTAIIESSQLGGTPVGPTIVLTMGSRPDIAILQPAA